METRKLSLQEMEMTEGGSGCNSATSNFAATLGAIAFVGGMVALGAATGGLAWGLGSAASVLFGFPATVTSTLCMFA